ncbi:MAG TPA: S24 family peptidase [Bacteriovoracaceae bacterium]|nr:S24 family peptidase [Bacteriovoracaceae bacterium]
MRSKRSHVNFGEFAQLFISLDLGYNIKGPFTFIFRAVGQSRYLNIKSGDLIIVDRKLALKHDSHVMAMVDGQFVYGKYVIHLGKHYLMPFKIQLGTTFL